MANQENLNTDDLTEQWLFDYYVDKCVTKSSQSEQVDDSSRSFLEVLMTHSIDPDYGMNKIKANMLIVMDYQFQLTRLDISDLESSHTKQLLQSKDSTTELFNLMAGLRDSLLYLEKESKKVDLCHACLLHVHAYIFQVLHSLETAGKTIYDSNELQSYKSAILKKAGKDLGSPSKAEKNILQACQNLLKGKEKAKKDLPSLDDLINLLGKLVKEIHATFPRPEIAKIAESYVRLQSKLVQTANGDLLTSQQSSKLSIEQIAQQKNSSSEADGQQGNNNSSSGDNGRPGKRKNSEKSDSEASSSTPQKVSRGIQQNKSRNTHQESRVSKAPQKNPVVIQAQEPKVKKPASHARVKKGPWTPEEEEEFVVSVLQIGVGKWVEVKNHIQAERSSVQLKDKWRNIPKSRIRSIAREHKLPVPK
ncbi:telomere repeat-binding factor 3 [Elysia marginata]|uniref:Telomere repeat-binding factor 3 n=1 Tax=Elysia marginata TaxID=1093978 RepID=A0AAV4G0E8_9GAST|nr:telomere repeat-binding factor 3 [Elysia marginata]